MLSAFLQRLALRAPWLPAALFAAGLFLAAVTLAATLWRAPRPPLPHPKEQFDPMLAGLSSVDELMLVLSTAYPEATPLQKLDAADALLRRRFRHGYSYLRFDQNWSAAMLRPIWDNLSSPVRPDDILAFRRAACSQQTLVFLEVASRLGFDHAPLRAPGHFMGAVRIAGQWWIYDANREVRVRRYPLSWLKQGDPRLNAIYEPSVARLLLAGARADAIELGEAGRFAAPRALLLHQVTGLFSRYGWLVCFGLWALLVFGAGKRRPIPGFAN